MGRKVAIGMECSSGLFRRPWTIISAAGSMKSFPEEQRIFQAMEFRLQPLPPILQLARGKRSGGGFEHPAGNNR